MLISRINHTTDIILKTFMKFLKPLLFGIITFSASTFSLSQTSLDPTGTYNQGKIEKDSEIYGYFGIIQVKKLSETTIVMTFYTCKGAPSYNSGSFVDTLDFINNTVTFTNDDCVTTFNFTKKGIDVTEKSEQDCWGHGVVAHGHFRKKSNKQPVLIEPFTGEKI